ncbi:MAG: cytochrome c oxidase accessory protein CcoG [Proteobacteria bacterium]|nr:cytochrome c oxidase accessory protein CcoG [Pseudomonadota bacterium]
MSDFRETLYTIDKRGKRKWVYANVIQGKFLNRRAFVAYFLIVFYLTLPWITINGSQAVFLDIWNRKFTFFGATFWATDTDFLVVVLLIFALSLFFFTSLIGRVWCGWACPETVFLEFVFRPIERIIEGNGAKRLKLDMSPWTMGKILKKLTKHGICASLAWVLSSTFLAYFIGREPLLNMMQGSPLNNLQPFLLTLIFMGVFGFQFGWFREQFCTVVCPYARFQSVLMDKFSLGVGYDSKRGEPRGKHKAKDDAAGDCVDCGLCVKVCPVGIDIRNGLQLECIHCACCIDACDSVMAKIGKPLGLIRYDCEESLLHGGKHRFGARPIIYGSVLIILFLVLTFKVAHREMSDVVILRGASDQAFSMMDENTVVNHLHLHISNKNNKPENYYVSCEEKNISIVVPMVPFTVQADAIATLPIFINLPKSDLQKGMKRIFIKIKSDTGFEKIQEVSLLGPGAI